ncbi:hypothetical protein Tco_1081209 [Tanacetum coccineum]|uniref:Uncharacterized protein n=1 Tax=Tanacetum coccineum TaxID=301880 RepID=A0ABQ5HX34_9ASTR
MIVLKKLISLLEVHGAAVPNEDANQKFLRALPSSWNNVALIMRNKEVGSSGHLQNSQNVAFLSTEDTSSSNESNSPQLDDEDLSRLDHVDLGRMTLNGHCLEYVEAQLVVHQKNEAVYEEKIAVLEFEVKDKNNAVTRLKNQLDES